jgi:hypothetical protein
LIFDLVECGKKVEFVLRRRHYPGFSKGGLWLHHHSATPPGM